jgi:hypothetical protein
MAVYPDIAPSGYTITPKFRTIKIGTDGDFVQRRSKRVSPLFSFAMTYRNITNANLLTLYDFYLARLGSYDDFAFFDFDSRSWSDFTIGTGNGVTTTFSVGGKSTSSLVIKVDSVTKTLTTHYTIQVAGGTNGQDQITFTAGNIPTTGQVITAAFLGRKYYPYVIFADDNMNYEVFVYAAYQVGVELVQVTE